MLSAAGSGKDLLIMDDPRTKTLERLDLISCRVEFSSLPIVLLCGGKVSMKERPNDPDPAISSLRHAITLTATSFELFRPEEITSWQSDAVFKNLIDFEEDLASICSLVVIVLESPGSIAELGAFSQLPDLSRKLIVIKSDQYTEDPSFINLGILRHIREAHDSSVKTYPWNIERPSEINPEVIEDAINDIQDELSGLKKSEVFKADNNAHIVVLICEIVNLFVALKESEIHKYLSDAGIEITKDELRSKLFLLENFRRVTRAEYSDSTFYMSGRETHHRLRLTPKEGCHIDALRIPIDCIEYYNQSTKERHRSRVIKQSIKGDAS